MQINQEEALKALARYPACIYPAVELLPEAEPQLRASLLRRIALCIPDEKALRTIIGLQPDTAKDNTRLSPTTDETITSFIGRFAPGLADASDLPIAPAVDYAATLEQSPATPQPEGKADPTASAIDSFLEEIAPKMPRKNDPPLSLALAKVMIKNGNYQKAIEIITELHLKNPKKSVYFADQIRFLQKLMLANPAPKA